MSGTWLALGIVAVVFLFVTNIVRMSLHHHENVKRIEHGYPTLEGTTSERSTKTDDYQN